MSNVVVRRAIRAKKKSRAGTRLCVSLAVLATSATVLATSGGIASAVPTTATPPTNTVAPSELERVGNNPVPAQTSQARPVRPESDGSNEVAAKARAQSEGGQAKAAPGCTDYWNPAKNSWFMVCGRILDMYNQLGGPGGFLGLPISNELSNPDGRGKRTHFTNDSSIYWSPETDAHQIGGRIQEVWAEQGWEAGPLGYPTTNELVNPDNVGRRNEFQNGAIYWSYPTNAHIIKGAIRETWNAAGWEAGKYGYPTSGEYDYAGTGKRQNFQYNVIDWNVPVDVNEVVQRVLNYAPDRERTFRALNDADGVAYKAGTFPDSEATDKSHSGAAKPLPTVMAQESGLDIEALTAPDAPVVPADDLPGAIQERVGEAKAGPGCWYANDTYTWRSLWGYDTFRQWMTLSWCWNGFGITSYDVIDRGAEGLLPAYNYIGQAGSGKQVIGNEARAYSQETFGFGLGTWLTSNLQLCIQIRGHADLFASKSGKCSLTEAW